MSLIFPKFENARCRRMTACGMLETNDKVVLEWLTNQANMDARYGVAGRTRYIHVMFGGKLGKHLHVDLAVSEHFGDTPPSVKDKIADVRNALKKLEKEKINVNVAGLFHLSSAELPDFIQATLQVETQVGDISLKTTGGSLAIRGTPVYRLQWWMPTDANHVCVELRARLTTQIQDSYLDECLAILEQAFKALVLGE